MVTGLHFLLTYKCLYECDHCFLYCGPRSEGTFTAAQLADALRQGVDAGIDHIFLEGGEPFLYYPLMLEALRLAHRHGLKAGIVTNCYWATSEADAELWLHPLVQTGALTSLSVSDDTFHLRRQDPVGLHIPLCFRTCSAHALAIRDTRSTSRWPRILAPRPSVRLLSAGVLYNYDCAIGTSLNCTARGKTMTAKGYTTKRCNLGRNDCDSANRILTS